MDLWTYGPLDPSSFPKPFGKDVKVAPFSDILISTPNGTASFLLDFFQWLVPGHAFAPCVASEAPVNKAGTWKTCKA